MLIAIAACFFVCMLISQASLRLLWPLLVFVVMHATATQCFVARRPATVCASVHTAVHSVVFDVAVVVAVVHGAVAVCAC